MRRYFADYLAAARAIGAGFVLDTVTWRSGEGWSEVMEIAPDDIDAVNCAAVAFGREIAASPAAAGLDLLLNGVVGPHGDAYAPDRLLDAGEAEAAHGRQVRVLAAEGVDVVTAMTIANASRKSHAELDESTELDAGDRAGLAEDYRGLMAALPALHIVGGCCGTDHTHVAAIGHRCRPVAA